MVCRRQPLGLVGPNTVTITIAVLAGSVESPGFVTAFSEVRCHLLCQLCQPSQLCQVYGDIRLAECATT
jgi:hypothetical protein